MNLYLLLTTRHLPLTKLVFSVACCLLSIVSYSQSWNWAKGEGDIGNDASNSITMDESGNAYITGNIAGRCDFSGTVYQGRGIYDVFIAKYDPQGNLLWVKLAGGDGNDQGNCIRYNKNFIYLTGYFSNTAWFESTMLTSSGEGDVFTAKYDLNGNLIWVRKAGGTGNEFGTSIDVDNAGNVFIGGSYENAMVFDTVHLSTANLYSESFFAKYNSSGNLSWAKSIVGNNANLITGVAFDNHSSVFLTGYFGGSFRIGSTTLNSSTPSYDIFLAKIDGNGNVVWMNKAGSNFEDAAHGVCSDRDGNPSIVGYFAGTATFGSNSITYHDYNDIFVAHYDALGNNLWVRAGKGQQLDIGFAITADDNGNIFATGMFQSKINFDGDSITGNAKDIFVVSYSPSGSFRWLTQAGATGTDCGLGIAVANSGVVAISGYYLLNCSFGNIQIQYADGNDMFIAEFTPPVVNSIKDMPDDLQVSLFPNPCSDARGCRLSLRSPEVSTIKIFDVLGNEILKDEFHSVFNIDPFFLPDGVYFVEVTGQLKRKTLKLVKQ